jgi:hypothetical protein
MNEKEFDCFYKINWAHRNIEQLDQAVNDWFKDGQTFSHEVVPNPDEPGTLLLKVSAVAIPIAPLSLVVGDIIQNIRSSLDYAVYQLAKSYGHVEFSKISHRSQFPIFGNVSNSGNTIDGERCFQENAINDTIKYISPAAQSIIESVQPYKNGDKFEEHPLWLLNKLSNIDKHRCLHVGAAYAGSYSVSKCHVSGDFPSAPVLVGNNTTVTKLGSLTPINPTDTLEKLVTPKMTICFKDGPFATKLIVATLASICNYVGSSVLNPLNEIENQA